MQLLGGDPGSIVTLGVNSLIITGTPDDDTFGGVIIGSGGLQVADGATFVLDGAAQAYTGSPVVYGKLDVFGNGSGTTLASSNVSLKASGGSHAGLFIIGDLSINQLTGRAGASPRLRKPKTPFYCFSSVPEGQIQRQTLSRPG